MPGFEHVHSVKFELYLPVTFTDALGKTRPVDLHDVMDHVDKLTAKFGEYGGYTASNPYAPPPFAGGFQGSPPERTFLITFTLPDQYIDTGKKDFEELVSYFQNKYRQIEIFAVYQSVVRLKPLD